MATRPPYRNAILNHLSAEDLALLRPHFEPVELGLRRRLAEANRPIDRVYFLEGGIASTAANVRHEVPIEIGIVGRDGVANLPVLMGTDRSPSDTFMQIAGSGFGVEAAAMTAAMRASPSLTRVLLLFVHVFMVQTSSTVLANGRATIAERLARWLLMAHDRVNGDEVDLTHEFLGIMLGVRRSSVTTALRQLVRRRIVRGGRGRITILDRQALVVAANGYYGTAEAEMRRLFGAPR